jgi:hypothetical protein
VTDKVKVSAFLFYSSTLNLIRRRTFQPQGIDITLATTVLLHLLWSSNLATFGYLRKLPFRTDNILQQYMLFILKIIIESDSAASTDSNFPVDVVYSHV